MPDPNDPRFSFTQPICDEHWAEFQPDREPYRLIEPEEEHCCVCDVATKSGIYIRVNPKDVPYPSREK